MEIDTPIITKYRSPNFGPRREGDPLDTVVIHYTDTRDIRDSLDILCDTARQVSAHYLVDEDGSIYSLVDETQRAWHAGVSYWRGFTDVNSRSIGIELQNPGERFGLRLFPKPQMDALISLLTGIKQRWPIEERNIIGHSDIAPDRKSDPGHLFDWEALANAGHGCWVEEAVGMPTQSLSMDLAEIGYDPACNQAVAAFQAHYRPQQIDNHSDAETAGIARALLQLFDQASR